MKDIITSRLLWLLWLTVVCLFIGDWLLPVSTTTTRSVGIGLLFTIWFGLIALVWRHRIARYTLLGITGICAVCLTIPGREFPEPSVVYGGDLSDTALRTSFIAGLKRYEGVTYYWGGESPKGIDCSGLIRRGLIDSMFLRGLRNVNASLIRYSLWLWWHDCTARDFGEGKGFTAPLFDVPSINALDPSTIKPGDLAVTTSGVHIMAYIGENRWIEADPSVGRVIIVLVPANDNAWFNMPMNIVRWNILSR